MNLILTMAGKYSRFINEGYKFPKYLLPWGSGTILSEILTEFMSPVNNFDNIFLVANRSDAAYMCHVKQIMLDHGINTSSLIMVNDTSGQAETAYLGASAIKELGGGIVFHNIDTILYNRDYSLVRSALNKRSGYIDVFNSNNHEYSYILEKDGLVNVISEKILISDIATSGLYGFHSFETFDKYYDGQIFISDIYKRMIEDGAEIQIGEVHGEYDTIVLGTPKEYITHSNNLIV